MCAITRMQRELNLKALNAFAVPMFFVLCSPTLHTLYRWKQEVGYDGVTVDEWDSMVCDYFLTDSLGMELIQWFHG